MRGWILTWFLGVTVLPTPSIPTPSRTPHLNCAAIRAALARGRSLAEVAVEYHTSTRLVLLCQQEKRHRQHGFQMVRTRTPIPERTDVPTPLFRPPERPPRPQ